MKIHKNFLIGIYGAGITIINKKKHKKRKKENKKKRNLTNSIYYDIKFYHPFLVTLIFFVSITFVLFLLFTYICFVETRLPAAVKNTILVAGMIRTAKSNLTIS